MAKMSPTGQNLYYVYFPGPEAKSIAVDSAGNAYIVAQASDGNIVAKLNPSGSAFVYYDIMPYSFEDIAVDSLGNAYVSGRYYQGTSKDDEVVVGKLNSAGSAFLYLVSFGGSSFDRASSIDIDTSGNAYVGGLTGSSNFPLWNALQTSFSGVYSSFVTKLNAAGTGLVYSTYLGNLGSSNFLRNRDIAVDGAGNAYVAVETDSALFPSTPGAAQPFLKGYADGYIAKLNTAGGLTYATYLGSTGIDRLTGIAVDGSTGTVYATGQTGGGMPVTSNAFQPVCYGADAFVTQVSPSGGSFSYSSYLGGYSYENVDNDISHNIALDSSKNVYVVGDTQSTNFPTTVYSHAGLVDAFITKFNGP
ncbi:Cell surface protein [Archangium gephyra]|uniref:Cell surface protein n=1 Tax=Archangium gephyra TaxID=48 RepID=A0AAC8QJ19_9BACT|nr:Cell surface protein [Archangium gephyra]